MGDFPAVTNAVTPLHLHTVSPLSGLKDAIGYAGTQFVTDASIAWAAANRAQYVPMHIPYPYPVKRVFWANGSSAGDHVDFGIYNAEGTRLYSTTSTVGSGNSSTQYVTPSPDFILAPGRYWFALALDNTTANRHWGFNVTISVTGMRLAGIMEESSAFPLPATMTPVAATAVCVPCCGVTRTASGF